MRVLFDPGIYFRRGFGGVQRNASEHERCLSMYPELQVANLRMHLKSKGIADSPLGRLHYIYWLETALARYLDQKQYDLVHFVNYYCPRIPSHINCPSITTIHDVRFKNIKEGNPLIRAHRNRVIARSLKLSDAIVTVSNTTRQNLINFYGDAYTEKIHTVYNGLSPFWFEEGGTDHVSPRVMEFCRDHCFVIAPGPLLPRKNHMLALRTLRPLLDEKKIIFAVFGKGPEQKRLQQYVHESGFKYFENLGFVSDEDMRYLHDHARCGLFLSDYEGFGIPIIEMGARGLPCLVANNSCLPEISGWHQDLVVAPMRNPLIVAARRIIEDDKIHAELSKYCRNNASKFTWERSVRVLVNLYFKVAKRA